MACSEESLKFVGAVIPVLVDFFAETYDDKHLLGKAIDDMQKQREVQVGLIEKGTTIKKIYNSLRKLKEFPSRICSQLENAHKDPYEIVLHFTSKELNYHLVPSVILQMMLTIAPESSVIARTLPYLETETDMNCRSRDMFIDNFRTLLYDHFKRIEVIGDDDFIHYHKLVARILVKLNEKVSKPQRDFIRCSNMEMEK